ncbi:MAG: type II secretion system protein [Planctomycetes bacterium]|nr:type II secretion system protein [Planctomycetota bacterium]
MDRKAFTLVELLVVIAIIALLMAILMPSLQAARQQAQMVACQSHLKHWGSIFMMFTNDNDGYFHPGWEDFRVNDHLWVHAYRPYYGVKEEYKKKNDDFRTCPSAAKIIPELPNGGSRFAWTGRGSLDWVGLEDEYGSYGLNGWVCHQEADASHNVPSYRPNYWRNIAVKGQLNKIPILCDSSYWKPYSTAGKELNPMYDWAHSLDKDNCTKAGTRNIGLDPTCIDRHNCTINMLFFDTSVSRTPLKELWDLKWHRKWEKPDWLETYEWPKWIKR